MWCRLVCRLMCRLVCRLMCNLAGLAKLHLTRLLMLSMLTGLSVLRSVHAGLGMRRPGQSRLRHGRWYRVPRVWSDGIGLYSGDGLRVLGLRGRDGHFGSHGVGITTAAVVDTLYIAARAAGACGAAGALCLCALAGGAGAQDAAAQQAGLSGSGGGGDRGGGRG